VYQEKKKLKRVFFKKINRLAEGAYDRGGNIPLSPCRAGGGGKKNRPSFQGRVRRGSIH